MTPPPVITNSSTVKSLGGLNPHGAPVNAKNYIEPGTSGAKTLAFFAACFGVLILGVVSYGILWVVLLFSPIINYFNRKKAMAQLKGSAIEIGPEQFPELHECAQAYAQRLGLKSAPAVYLVEGNVINAAAVKVAGRHVIVLMDDIVDACLRSGDTRTLAFILAHEMAHHALGHTSTIRGWLSRAMKKLSRLDEFSCDAVANALVGDPQAAAKAIVLLVSGPQLLPYVNVPRLCQQAREVQQDKHSEKSERELTHPLILRRLSRFI